MQLEELHADLKLAKAGKDKKDDSGKTLKLNPDACVSPASALCSSVPRVGPAHPAAASQHLACQMWSSEMPLVAAFTPLIPTSTGPCAAVLTRQPQLDYALDAESTGCIVCRVQGRIRKKEEQIVKAELQAKVRPRC